MVSSFSFKNIVILCGRILLFLRSFIARIRIRLRMIRVKDVFYISQFFKYIGEMIRVSPILIIGFEFEF